MKKSCAATLFIVLISLFLSGTYCPAASEKMTFRKQVIMDHKGFGYEALRLLLPKTWKFNGGISWNYNKIPPEASTAFTITSPDNTSVFEQFPHMNLFWSQDQNLRYSYAQAGFEILQPMSAQNFLKDYFIPRYRSRVSELKIKETSQLESLARQVNELTQHQMNLFGRISPFQFPFELRSDAAHIQVEYTLSGIPTVEDFTVSISYMVAYIPGMYGGSIGATTWIPTVTSFKAPKKEMNEKVKIFRIIADSRKDNPKWSEDVVKLTATITRDQIRQQNAIFRSMQQISRTQSEISDMIMESYEKRNAAYDRIFDNYSQAIRGVDTYVDPVNDWKVELPTGYDNAWTDGNDYIFSDDAGFNPNIGSNKDWKQMQRQ